MVTSWLWCELLFIVFDAGERPTGTSSSGQHTHHSFYQNIVETLNISFFIATGESILQGSPSPLRMAQAGVQVHLWMHTICLFSWGPMNHLQTIRTQFMMIATGKPPSMPPTFYSLVAPTETEEWWMQNGGVGLGTRQWYKSLHCTSTKSFSSMCSGTA